MHASSMENMRDLRDRFCSGPMRVLDIGSADVAGGCYRDLFSGPGCEYLGADLARAPNVDVVLASPYELPFEAGSFDLVISGQTLEHVPQFWRSFAEMARVSRSLVFLIVPSAGPIHRYPVDCYRFLPDSMQALAEFAGWNLVESYVDEREPWRDLVGVFSLGSPPPARPRRALGA
jgi:SAM-dependent methyltransferase